MRLCLGCIILIRIIRFSLHQTFARDHVRGMLNAHTTFLFKRAYILEVVSRTFLSLELSDPFHNS